MVTLGIRPLEIGRERDGKVCGPLADPRGAAHGARAIALERRSLVGVGVLDLQLVADELVVVLGVRDGRLEQLAPVARRLPGSEVEDRARLLDGLSADVVADE